MATRTRYKDLRSFGCRVRDRRKQLGISQEELADQCGLHRTYIGSIERGERNVALLNILKICRALKAGPEELLRGIR